MKSRSLDHLNETFSITDLRSLIKGFVLNCRCEGKSPKTISFYQDNLQRFLWYVASEPVRWGGKSTSSRKAASIATVAHYYHCLNVFFSWLVREKLTPQNPLSSIQKPHKEKRVIQALSTEQIRILLSHCPPRSALGCRNRAIVTMLLDTGMRVSELAALRLPDFDPETGALLIEHGKGRKQRLVRIGAATQKVLWRYITTYRKGTSDRIFRSKSGGPLEANAIKLVVRRLGKKCNIPKVHVHRLRHTFAIGFLRAGGDIFSLRYLLGHSSLTMVANYLGSLDADDALRAHRRLLRVAKIT
jgi:site-specific recombinase XerD